MPKAKSTTPKRRYVPFTRWRRRRFFALREESGNVRAKNPGAAIAAPTRPAPAPPPAAYGGSRWPRG
jgi:hypothetical protein